MHHNDILKSLWCIIQFPFFSILSDLISPQLEPSPHPVIHAEERFDETHFRVIREQTHIATEAVDGTLELSPSTMRIILTKVSAHQDFVQHQSPLLYVRSTEQICIWHRKDLLQDPHHRRHKFAHSESSEQMHRLLLRENATSEPLLPHRHRRTVFTLAKLIVPDTQHHIIIQQLTQPYSLHKQMTEDVHHLVDDIKRSRRYREDTIPDPGITEVPLFILLKPLLQTAIPPGRFQIRR